MDLGFILIVGLALVGGITTALVLQGWQRRRDDRNASVSARARAGATPPPAVGPGSSAQPTTGAGTAAPEAVDLDPFDDLPVPHKLGAPAPVRAPFPDLFGGPDPAAARPVPPTTQTMSSPAPTSTDFDPFSAPTADLYPGLDLDLSLDEHPTQPGAGAGAAQLEPDPVLIGVTAPQICAPGSSFNAVLATYVEAARASAQAQLQRLGGPQSVPLLDLPPDRQSGWIVGAPVTVRLSARGADVEPAERSFDWNGRLNLAAFSVQVHDNAKVPVELCFQVALAGVPIAMLPLPVIVSAGSEPAPLRQRDQRAPASAFASYASKDAQLVGYCLSALSRWSPGLTVFQDCLDLQQNETFKPQLQQHIHASDCFLLFWSRNASASKWVQWEYDTARNDKGLDAVIPMPLEDPAIAAPPPEFTDLHLRDRFMLARYGLARIQDEAEATRPPAQHS